MEKNWVLSTPNLLINATTIMDFRSMVNRWSLAIMMNL